MKYIFLLTLCLVLTNICLAQTNTPVEITEAMKGKLKQDVEKEIPRFKLHLQNLKYDSVMIAFAVDTFKIEHFVKKWLEMDQTTAGMNAATYEGARQYDMLLNKYYKKLMLKLTTEDKQQLIQAQKAWLAFRDAETKLFHKVNHEVYGHGTIQTTINASDHSELIKARAISLYQYYSSFFL